MSKHLKHVEHFLNNSVEQRGRAELRRDYVDNKQWTAEEEATLNARGQAATVDNRIKPKVDGLLGLLVQRKSDPKAFPRTEKHAKAAEAVTDGLRFVVDNQEFDDIKLEVADNFFVEGYGGAVVEIKGEEIQINHIPWDRIYYDLHSRKHDFSDALYMGVVVWVDREILPKAWRDKIELGSHDHHGTFDDRPAWIDHEDGRDRVRLAEEYFIENGKWHHVVFSGEVELVAPAPSKYKNEKGDPINPIVLVGSYIDRNNVRFGDVEYWIDPQDGINKRSSKFLHLNSQRQTAARKGAIADIPAMKREMAKPDGHVEYEGEKGDFEVLGTGDMSDAQFALLQENKRALETASFNAQLSGDRAGALSGVAVEKLQAAGLNEVAPNSSLLTGWEKRIYRQIWFRIRQFWTAEKWIRVTDDHNDLRWVGFNVEIPLEQLLIEQINDESMDITERRQSAALFQQLGGGTQQPDPRLKELVETRNKVAELKVDIILNTAPDTINIQKEQFDKIVELAGNRPEVPFTTVLELSTFRDKEKLIKEIKDGQQNQAQIAQQQIQSELQKEQQLAQISAQGEQQKIQAKAEADLITEKQKIESAERIEAAKLQTQREIAAISKSVDTNRHQLERGTKQIASTVEIPAIAEITNAIEELAKSNQDDSDLQTLIKELQRPVTIQRDSAGRAVSVQ